MAAIRIVLKDIRQRLRDRSAYLWGIAAPFGLAAIFSLLFGDLVSAAADFSYAVADEDGGSAARVFVEQVLAPLDEEGVFTIEEVGSAAEARARAEDARVNAAFVIPAGFSQAVAASGTSAIEVVANVDSPIAGEVGRAVAGQFVGEINAVGTSLGTYFAVLGRAPEPGEAGALVEAAMAVPSPLSLGEVETATKELSIRTFYAAGMAILFLFLTVQFGVLGLLEERQNGTMGRLLAAPISRRSIVVGKALTSFILGLVSMAVLVVGSTWLLGAEWGNSLGVAILVLAGVIAAMGVMFVVAAFARTPEQAGNLQAIIAFVLAMLGGCFFPIAQAGGFLETLSLLTPHAWFLRGLGDLAAGGGAGAVFPAAFYLVLFGLVIGGLAQFRIGKVLAP
ncbi:MAG TPA: ABC transporter permease [Acidimicrobiia bacterium]|nr:ABC transporter permease [Acidimicrobiia bacterium]